MPSWEEIRAQIPAVDAWLYVNNAATSPVPHYVRAAMDASLERRARDGDAFFDDACRRADGVRADIGRHLGVDPAGVAFMKNTGEGINHVARSLPIPPGANIVITALEFPTNRLPWQALAEHGIELRVAAPDDDGLGVSPDALARHVDDRTALVAASWVTFNTGYRHDVDAFGKIAHDHEALLLVDGIQGLGAVAPPPMRHVDFFASGGHKWLMAPFGAGFLWMDPRRAETLTPDHLGWWSLADTEDYDAHDLPLAAGARRFEIGNLGFDVIEGYGAAMRAVTPIAPLEARLHALVDRLMEGVEPLGRLGTPRDRARRAGIVRLVVEEPARVHARLTEDRVACSLRSGALRLSPHFWNTEEEIDRLVALVRSAVGR